MSVLKRGTPVDSENLTDNRRHPQNGARGYVSLSYSIIRSHIRAFESISGEMPSGDLDDLEQSVMAVLSRHFIQSGRFRSQLR